MTKEFCDICGRPIETYKNVSEFKLKKAVHTLHESWWRRLTDIINAFQGEEALDLHKKLVTKKEKNHES